MITPARNVKGIISEAYDIHSKEKYNRGDTRRRSHVHSEEFRNQQVHAAEKGEKREGQAIIEELIASRFTEANVENELYRLLTDEVYRRRMLDGYTRIRSILGSSPAARTAAKIITSK